MAAVAARVSPAAARHSASMASSLARRAAGPPRPLAGGADRRRHAAAAGHLVGRERPLERLFEGPRVAEVGGGVGRFLEELRRPLRLVGDERHPPEDDQAPRRERMVELVADEQAAGEERRGEIGLALRPVGGAERDVDPRVRPVVWRSGPTGERLGDGLEPAALPRELAEQRAMAVDRDHQRPHDLLRPHGPIVGGREHSAALQHLLRVAALLPDRHRLGEGRGRGVALAAAPRGATGRGQGPQGLERKLHRQEPVGMRGEDEHRLLVARHGVAQAAELVEALAEDRGGRDRVDPALGAHPHAPLVVVAGDVGRRRIVAGGERRQREVVGPGGHALDGAGNARVGGQHHLPRREARGRERGERGRHDAARRRALPHAPPCAASHAARCTPDALSAADRRSGGSLGRPGKRPGGLGILGRRS